MKSTTGHYVQRAARNNKPPHSALSQDELNELFIKAGWIGRWRSPVMFIKTAPHIEGKRGR